MYIIRPYHDNDQYDVCNVLHQSGLAKTLDESRTMLLHELQTGHEYFVVQTKESLVGIVSGRQHGLYRHGLYELYHIGIIPDYTGTGVARDLFMTLLDHAQSSFEIHGSKLRKFFLLSGEQNIRAHRFYHKMGMSQNDVLKDHFASGRNELVFDIFFDTK